MLDTLSERLPLRSLTQKEQKQFMSTYFHNRSIGIVLLVCVMIFSMIAVTTLIDAGPKKKRPGTVSPSVEVDTWWDHLTDAMDAEEIIERLLKSIGLLRETRADLEYELKIRKAYAVYANNQAKSWENRKKEWKRMHDDASTKYTNAETALNSANYTITLANEDIAEVNRLLDVISRRSGSYYDSNDYSDEIDRLEQQKEDLIAQRTAAEADIPIQERIMRLQQSRMTVCSQFMAGCDGRIAHHREREAFHDAQIEILNRELAAVTAQEAAEVEASERLDSLYANKNNEEQAGSGESSGLSHTGTDTTIDLGETHSFEATTEVFYDVHWYMKKKGESGLGKLLTVHSGGSNANTAEVNIEFSSENGIEPYANYVITARVKRLSDQTTYDLIYEVSVGP